VNGWEKSINEAAMGWLILMGKSYNQSELSLLSKYRKSVNEAAVGWLILMGKSYSQSELSLHCGTVKGVAAGSVKKALY
jgi:hypothetical protein